LGDETTFALMVEILPQMITMVSEIKQSSWVECNFAWGEHWATNSITTTISTNSSKAI
jgi:hypothetical protein